MKNGISFWMTCFLAACMLASCGRTDDKPAVSGLSKMICDESFQNIMDDEIDPGKIAETAIGVFIGLMAFKIVKIIIKGLCE